MGTYRGCGWGRGGSVRREGGAGQAERRGSAGAAAPWRAGLLELWFKHSNGWLPPDPSGHSSCPEFASLREKMEH